MSDQSVADSAIYMTHKNHNRTPMPLMGLEPAIPAMKWTYTLDRMVSGTGRVVNHVDTSLLTLCEVHHMCTSFHFIHEVTSLCHSVLHVLSAITTINVSPVLAGIDIMEF